MTTSTKQPDPREGQRPARRTVIKAALVMALIAGLVAWVYHLLRWPSDLEVHNELSARTDSQAVKMAMLANISRYDDPPTVPKAYRLESSFEPPCLLMRAEIRTAENLIAHKFWVYVFLRRHGIDERTEPVGAVGVFVAADPLGFERFNPRLFPTRRYVTDEIYKFGSPERVTYVGECPP